MLDRDAAVWEDYFGRHRVSPHTVVYEDLVADYEAGLRGCLDFLGVDARPRRCRLPESGGRPTN